MRKAPSGNVGCFLYLSAYKIDCIKLIAVARISSISKIKSCLKRCESVRLPTDIPLSKYIRLLIKENKIALFYLSDDWKELRQEVLDELHNECQECLKDGEYTKADCVHHVNEVRHRPDLALSKFYVDKEGKQQRQLVPLCNKCHNLVHDKLGEWQKRDKFSNEERW